MNHNTFNKKRTKGEFTTTNTARNASPRTRLILLIVVLWLLWFWTMPVRFLEYNEFPQRRPRFFFESIMKNRHDHAMVEKTKHIKNRVEEKKKHIMYVISLQDVQGAAAENAGRLDEFRHDWTNHNCVNIEFHHCPGELDEKRGYGLTRAYIQCFERAKQEASQNKEDVFVFLEDDARLYNFQFCNATIRQKLWSYIPDDASLVLLGGHTWQFLNDNYTTSSLYRQSNFSFGTYGFVLPTVQELQSLQDGYMWHLQHPLFDYNDEPIASPDKYLYQHAMKQKLNGSSNRSNVYVTNPMIVYHEAGYSNTWQAWRQEEDGTTILEEDEYDDEEEEVYEEEVYEEE